jgi:hypothetical protein
MRRKKEKVMNGVAILSIVLAAMANMVIGALWYSRIFFGNVWIKLLKLSPKDIEDANTSIPYVITGVGSLVMAGILWLAYTNVGDGLGLDGVLVGATIGGLGWLGFTAPTQLANALFESKPIKLYLIDVCYPLVSFIVMGIIIGAIN